jgi:cytochrome b
VNQPDPSHVIEHRIWDLPVRIFHWALVLTVIGAYITHQLPIQYFKYHVWCGYAVLVLVGFRIAWGLIGTRHARFWNFIRGPVTTVRYGLAMLRRRDQPYAGHNPLGAWMVVILLAALLTQAITGLFGNDEVFNFGPLYGYVSNEQSLELTSLHRQLFYWIVGAIALHIAAVVYHRVARGERLTRAMFTGRKSAAHVGSTDAIQSSRVLLAIIVAAAVAGVLAYIVTHAPAPQTFDTFN